MYELDTLPHKAGSGSEQLSQVISGSCSNWVHTTTTEQCQLAAGSVWDVPREEDGEIANCFADGAEWEEVVYLDRPELREN